MKYQLYYKWALICLACCCTFFIIGGIGAALSQSTSFAHTKTISVVVTPSPTALSTTVAQPTPTVIAVSQPSSYSDPSSIIAILALIVQAITLFLVVKYVRDTAAMAKATRDSADATRDAARAAEKTVQEMKAARDEESAPFVVVYFNYIHSRHQSLYLVVENIGKSIARDITLEFTPPLQVSQFNRDRIENNELLKSGIKSLVPNCKIPIPFDLLTHYIQANLPMTYTVKVAYSGNRSLPPIMIEYSLDLNHFKYIHFVTETGLSEIDESLQRLAGHFNHYSSNAEATNNLLNHIANAISRGLIVKNRIFIDLNDVDNSALLKEFAYLWVVVYGKQKENWNKPFIFDLRAKASLMSEELLKFAITVDSSGSPEWVGLLKRVIDSLSKLGNMILALDNPEGAFSTASFLLFGGKSKEDFDNLGDSIVLDIKSIIELVEKEKTTPLNNLNNEKEKGQHFANTKEVD